MWWVIGLSVVAAVVAVVVIVSHAGREHVEGDHHDQGPHREVELALARGSEP